MANSPVQKNYRIRTLISPEKIGQENVPLGTAGLAGSVDESLRVQPAASARRCGSAANRRASSVARLALLAFFTGLSPFICSAPARIIIQEQFD